MGKDSVCGCGCGCGCRNEKVMASLLVGKKDTSYTFEVPNVGAIDYTRIDRERWEDAMARGDYHNDVFMVTSKLFEGNVLLGVSKKFMSRFEVKDGISLCNQPFGTVDGISAWGYDYGILKGYYRYYFITPEAVGGIKVELAAIRKIHVHRTTVSVTSI